MAYQPQYQSAQAQIPTQLNAVQQFVKDWPEKFANYEKLAAKASELCSAHLRVKEMLSIEIGFWSDPECS